MLYAIVTILITGVTANKVHYVLPDNKLCISLPCQGLQYFIDNSDRYFISNSKFIFSEGTYYHTRGDLIVQDITNISFIGPAVLNTSRTPTSIINCFPEHTIKFHNVVNITITNILFESCGNEEAIPIPYTDIIIHTHQQRFWASIFFIACININVSNVHVDNPVGYGIMCVNIMGRNSLNNVTFIIKRRALYQRIFNSCSSGIYITYSGSKELSVTANITIFGVVLIQDQTAPLTDCYGDTMIAVSLTQKIFGVCLTISRSIFSQLHGNIIKITIDSFANNSIHFNNCTFINNQCIINAPYEYGNLIDVDYKLTCYSGVYVTITDSYFKHTNNDNRYLPCAILYFKVKGKYESCSPHYDNVLINFTNVEFYHNAITLLQVSSTLPAFETIVTITADTLALLYNFNHNKIIMLYYTKFYLRRKSMIIGNRGSDIIYLHSSKLMFSNYTLFYRNTYCNQLMSLNGHWQYMVLKDYATLEFLSNDVYNELISVPKLYNYPYRYCLYQFISDVQNNLHNFNISFSHNTEREININRSNSTLNKLSSHCKWINETALENVDKSSVYNKIITYEKKLGTHINVCYCWTSSHYNCNEIEMGPIYPGQTLNVSLCLPYNFEDTGVLYAETYNDNLPVTSCRVIHQENLKYTFVSNHTKSVNFTITSNSPTKCELFLTAQPDLYSNYDVFNIKLLPCPLGFAFHNGVCDCDPLLNSYTEECVIQDQTVKRLPNHWITGNTSSDDIKYLVSDSCLIEHCCHELIVDVHRPDTQCQQHRTGLLCSHCAPSYSVVFGSLRCRKCTNVHLIFILLVMLTGILLVAFMFICNLTVATGTINGIILFVNIIEMNGHLFNLQNRLVNPLLSYLIVINFGMCFEMCFFNGMDIYVKKWLQLAYPTYLAMIAILFIIASRYSSKLYRLTHNRSLPVLATLFMLTYTNVLQIISSVFLYTTIVSLPSKSLHMVWSLDPDVPLLGWKFMLLIIVCLLLFSLLLMLNAVLLFTKLFMKLKIIHRFKPIIDAFQGPFKHHCYYWIGLQLLLRNVMFLFSALAKGFTINIGCIIIITISTAHAYIQPYKRNIINFQEILLLYGYAIMCVLIFLNGSEFQNVIVLNTIIGLSLVHFMVIIIYHVFTYIIHPWLLNSTCKWYKQRRSTRHDIELQELEMDFQEPLIGQD